VHVPTFIVTGEAGLDRVVPPQLTAEYARLWPHARAMTLPRTGHLGLITRADAFADILVPFVESCQQSRTTNGGGPNANRSRAGLPDAARSAGAARARVGEKGWLT